MITEESVREVLETARIEEVVRDFVDLRRRGQNYLGLCPFHSEKTPSFNVNPSRNIYKCFGCGEGGDPVKFLREHEQLSFPDAIRWLAHKYNLKLKETEPDPRYEAEQQAQETLYLLNQTAREFFEQQLFQSERGKSVGLSYLRERGYREDIIRKFGLGYAPPETDALARSVLKLGYTSDQLDKLGLARGGRDFFRDRVMFPIHNVAGKIAAFAGRMLHQDRKAPKYINSPESEIYHKSDVLYGLFQARRAIRKEDNCLLVEGYTDVISLHQAGIEHVVASSGTSLTVGQIKLIRRYTQQVTILYDGDKAGVKAALRGTDLLLESGLDVRVVLLPDGEDPDSYVKQVGADQFGRYLRESAKDFILFQTDLLLEEAGQDPIRRAALVKAITATIAKVPDPIKRALYTKECASQFGLSEAILVAEVNRHLGQQFKQYQEKKGAALPSQDESWPTEAPPQMAPGADSPTGPPGSRPAVGDEYLERDIVRILMTSGHQLFEHEPAPVSVAQYIVDHLEDVIEEFDHAMYRRIAELCMYELDNSGTAPDPDFYLQHEDERIQQLAIDFNTSSYVYSPNWEKRNVVLNQKPPEENFVLDSKNTVASLRLFKIKRLLVKNAAQIATFERAGEQEQLLLHLRLQLRLKEIERELAQHTRTVIR